MKKSDSQLREASLQRTVTLRDGEKIPQLGMGTWHMGDKAQLQKQEIEALQRGLTLGLKLIDTAEMYGSGASEILIQQALQGVKRDDVFLVSKVYPHNASRSSIFEACQKSLHNLGQDYLDLYLLHWRGSVPLEETVSCMEEMISEGLIRRWGVSNFDTSDLQELWRVEKGSNCAVNQVMYHIDSRGIEFDLLPWMQEHDLPLMAYSPLAQAGKLSRNILQEPTLLSVAQRHGVMPAQILLAFVMRHDNVIAIPKASTAKHVEENVSALMIDLTQDDIEELSTVFPAPTSKQYLDII